MGNKLRMYSAPIIAKRKDFGFLLIVEKNTSPPGLHKSEQVLTSNSGSGTCSIASRQETTSKAFLSRSKLSASPRI